LLGVSSFLSFYSEFVINKLHSKFVLILFIAQLFFVKSHISYQMKNQLNLIYKFTKFKI